MVAAASLGAATSRTMEQLQAATAAAAAAAAAADPVFRGGGSVTGRVGEALPSVGPRKPRISGDKEKRAGKDGGVAAGGREPSRG